jgi:hypothetical protein
MNRLLFGLSALALVAGCVVTPAQDSVVVGVAPPAACVAYVGPVGFYDSACGYWGGPVVGWDHNWFASGHGGYGHGSWNRDDRAHAKGANARREHAPKTDGGEKR